MIPKELCHYTKRETALEKILFGRKIKFSQLGLTNDPKETKFQTRGIADSLTDEPPYNDIANAAERIQKEEWKVLCLTKHLPKRKITDPIKKDFMYPFLPGYSRPKMWAQYAENHSGVCLIFNGDQLLQNIEKSLGDSCRILHGSVSYKNYGVVTTKFIDFSDIKTLGLTEGIRKHFLDHYKDYFLSKYLDWQNESEYRWLVHSPTNSPEYVTIEGALTAVLVGIDFPKVYIPALVEVCKGLNISAGEMEWTDGRPRAYFGSIYNPKTNNS